MDIKENVINKFAAGKCTAEEAEEALGYFRESYRDPVLYRMLIQLWYKNIQNKENTEQKDINLAPTLDKLHHRINILKEEERSKTKNIRQFKKILGRIAAILILPLIVTGLLYIDDKLSKAGFTKVEAITGCRVHHQLPDGTSVWLNSGSTLEYPNKFSKRSRIVKLSGEAYFDVTQNGKSHFMVETSAVNIYVTGTQFNIMAYDEDSKVNTTLEKGKIFVEIPEKGNIPSRTFMLNPGEHVVINKESGDIKKYHTDTYKYTSWKDGKLIFRNDPLSDIIKRLERWYNTSIEIAGDPKLPDTRYTMTIEDETITQVLEYMSVASPITWNLIPSYKEDNGNIIKQKYLINNKMN